MQKIPVNSSIVIEVSDGRLSELQDSLTNLEYLDAYRESQAAHEYGSEESYDPDYTPAPDVSPKHESEQEEENEENSQYF